MRFRARARLVPKKTITCPRCQKPLGVPVEKMGRWITCPLCQMEFAALTDEPEESPAVTGDGEEDQEFAQAPPNKPLSLGAILTLSLMGAAVLFGLLALIASRHPAPTEDEQIQASEARQPVPALSPEKMPPLVQQQPGPAMPSLDALQPLNDVASTVKQFVFWTTVSSVIMLVSSVIMILWVVRDARNRGMEGVGVWISAVFFLNFFGLLIYLAAPARRAGCLPSLRQPALEECQALSPLRQRKQEEEAAPAAVLTVTAVSSVAGGIFAPCGPRRR